MKYKLTYEEIEKRILEARTDQLETWVSELSVSELIEEYACSLV